MLYNDKHLATVGQLLYLLRCKPQDLAMDFFKLSDYIVLG
jgi:hypothetical protein